MNVDVSRDGGWIIGLVNVHGDSLCMEILSLRPSSSSSSFLTVSSSSTRLLSRSFFFNFQFDIEVRCDQWQILSLPMGRHPISYLLLFFPFFVSFVPFVSFHIS
jgi:hypothetical protein